jgi:hypothetical protein
MRHHTEPKWGIVGVKGRKLGKIVCLCGKVHWMRTPAPFMIGCECGEHLTNRPLKSITEQQLLDLSTIP